MKMETEVKAAKSGIIQSITVAEGAAVSVGDELLAIA
jgi:biotin carboxyl carrier protein